MEMFHFAISLLLLSSAVQYSSCERFNIVPSPDSPCPGELTGEPCLTLQQYVANPGLSSIPLELHPGNHSLDSQLRVSNINSFTMRANTSATVTCNQQLSQPFYFNRLQQIHVSGITFVVCRMYLGYITNALFESNSFINRTGCCQSGAAISAHRSLLLIRACSISNNKGYNRGAIYLIDGNMDIVNSVVSNNSLYHWYDSGGAIYFDGGNITVINSTFINEALSCKTLGAFHS